jgi:glycerophosphoryl diester phosphodiesterase
MLVIAHRGASGYLPEHSLEAKALAFGMNPDFIEQDVVLTKDNVPIIVHDIHLDTVTNVASLYPELKRDDGRFYAIDLTLEQIKKLSLTERISIETGKAVFPNRFPLGKSSFKIPTLAEEIELIQGLNKSMEKNIGIYTEIKEPAWHQKEGKDISKITLEVLNTYGYNKKDSNCYLQCFDGEEVKRIKNELKSDLKLVLLMEEPVELAEFKGIVDGIGPSIMHLITMNSEKEFVSTGYAEKAHTYGMVVHPWTLRADSLPKDISFPFLANLLIKKIGVDGIFTDFPDRLVKIVSENLNQE